MMGGHLKFVLSQAVNSIDMLISSGQLFLLYFDGFRIIGYHLFLSPYLLLASIVYEIPYTSYEAEQG